MTVSIDSDLNASAGGGTPGGSDTEVQFNDGGSALGGDAGLTYNKTSNVLTNTGGNIVNTQAVAATSTDGLILQTSSTATAGAQKYSPRLHFKGSGWKTDATAAAQSVDWGIEAVPVQGSANPSANLQFSSSINGGAYSTIFYIGSDSNAYIASAYQIGTPASFTLSITSGNFYAKSDFVFGWSSGSNPLTTDTYLARASAANIRQGSSAANPPVAQTTSVQNASGTDIAGAARTYIASLGTGAGAPGTHVFQTGTTLGTGTTLQTATTRFTIAESTVTVAPSTPSSGPATGALVVTGGLGVGGVICAGGNICANNNSSGFFFGSGFDANLDYVAAAHIRMGEGAANPPVAQTLSVQNASGTDIAGATWTHIASLGTGAGTPGTHVFQTGATLGTGTTLQTATTRFTIAETRLTAAVPVVLPSYTVANLPTGAAGMVAFVTDANATTFASVVAGGGANGVPVYHDGTNWRIG